MSTAPYQHLLAPGRIGTLELRNRIAVTAMGVAFAEEDGTCGDQLIAYHEEQARGGVGLIIMGATSVSWPVGAVHWRQVALSEDRHIPSMQRLAEAVHRHGGRIAAQLHHGGQNAIYGAAAYGEPLWLPSLPLPPKAGDFLDAFLPEELGDAAHRTTPPQIRVMDEADIATVVSQFAAAAVRARAAGLDGIEIHGGHGYVLSSFLSPSTNRRTDRYGGPVENRARIVVEVVEWMRAAVGRDFPLWCKLDWREAGKEPGNAAGNPVGIALEDALAVAAMLEAAGVDAITVSAYHDASQGRLGTESYIPHTPELNFPAAGRIKRAIGIPVIASGRIEPAGADARIAAGDCDFVAMGRKLLADPNLPRKLAQGHAAQVRPCINCYTCINCIFLGQQARCSVNPELGGEYLPAVAKASGSGEADMRRVVVVGGGPAGMEAARRLDAAGQQVILLERGDRLGGTLRFAALGYEPNEGLLDWLGAELARSRVDVRLGSPATVEAVRAMRPDAVIVATGAVRAMPPIPGADLPHVLSGDDLRQLMLGQFKPGEASPELAGKVSWAARLATRAGALTGLTGSPSFVRKASRQWMPLGKRVVIIGGELVGLELAEFLGERGRSVAVVEEFSHFGRGLTILRRARLLADFRDHGVALHSGASAIAIQPAGVSFTDAAGKGQTLGADHVIVAKGAHGDSTLADALRAAGLDVHEIGDGTGVGYIEGAMRDAADVVRTLLEQPAPLPA